MLALARPEIIIENVVLVFHPAVSVDDADPLMEMGQDSLQFVALCLNAPPRSYYVLIRSVLPYKWKFQSLTKSSIDM